MKPLTEIIIRLCGLCCMILCPLFGYLCPADDGWTDLLNMLLMCVAGVLLGIYITDLLIAFKKWWKE